MDQAFGGSFKKTWVARLASEQLITLTIVAELKESVDGILTRVKDNARHVIPVNLTQELEPAESAHRLNLYDGTWVDILATIAVYCRDISFPSPLDVYSAF
jgi:hypothetical protein